MPNLPTIRNKLVWATANVEGKPSGTSSYSGKKVGRVGWAK